VKFLAFFSLLPFGAAVAPLPQAAPDSGRQGLKPKARESAALVLPMAGDARL
jgi:hypothetical protein